LAREAVLTSAQVCGLVAFSAADYKPGFGEVIEIKGHCTRAATPSINLRMSVMPHARGMSPGRIIRSAFGPKQLTRKNELMRIWGIQFSQNILFVLFGYTAIAFNFLNECLLCCSWHGGLRFGPGSH
jgi:hypothetical protein